MVWKASMSGAAGYPEDEPCDACAGEGVVYVPERATCQHCGGTGKQVDATRAGFKTLQERRTQDIQRRRGEPMEVDLTNQPPDLTEEEKFYLQQNLALPKTEQNEEVWDDWQQRNKGEPMDIAWRLLKEAFFAPKSGYEGWEGWRMPEGMQNIPEEIQ